MTTITAPDLDPAQWETPEDAFSGPFTPPPDPTPTPAGPAPQRGEFADLSPLTLAVLIRRTREAMEKAEDDQDRATWNLQVPVAIGLLREAATRRGGDPRAEAFLDLAETEHAAGRLTDDFGWIDVPAEHRRTLGCVVVKFGGTPHRSRLDKSPPVTPSRG